eukprot:GHVU01021595.1.p2 GENE.GHVU01021595.1~~GHVU01021595.1.p2  ORF type:complete len:117 (-),score=7.62 GHVU01021595.1:311-661(-)
MYPCMYICMNICIHVWTVASILRSCFIIVDEDVSQTVNPTGSAVWTILSPYNASQNAPPFAPLRTAPPAAATRSKSASAAEHADRRTQMQTEHTHTSTLACMMNTYIRMMRMRIDR